MLPKNMEKNMIKPIKLHGKWKIGIALDKHIKSSELTVDAGKKVNCS